MKGEVIVDNIDIYDYFKVGVSYGGYNGLVEFQSLKNPDINNWPEEHGIEVDLIDPKLENKIFSIKFYGLVEDSIKDFINLLNNDSYHTFDFRSISIIRTLRFTKLVSRNTIREVKEFELEFSDDTYPFESYVKQDLIKINVNCPNRLEIDYLPVNNYGIYHVDELIDEILVIGNIKQALTINEPSINSVLYDSGSNVVYLDRDITLNLTLHAPINTFWNNWYRFFYDLTRPDERILYYIPKDEYYQAYYKSCSINRFEILTDGTLWCDFSVILCGTDGLSFHYDYVLATEDYHLIATEQDHAIRTRTF